MWVDLPLNKPHVLGEVGLVPVGLLAVVLQVVHDVAERAGIFSGKLAHHLVKSHVGRVHVALNLVHLVVELVFFALDYGGFCLDLVLFFYLQVDGAVLLLDLVLLF